MFEEKGVMFRRVWAMPSRHTFTIKPIEELLKIYVVDKWKWIDPFSGWNSPAGFTNDLNSSAPAMFHIDAEEFICMFNNVDGILIDPPYSPRQMSECYKSIGMKVGMAETQNATLYSRVKDAAKSRIRFNGIAICCGWNSNGMGLNRGFVLEEVLLVAHGAAHNDTIVTVERRVK